MIILAKTSQLFSADSLVGKSSYGSIALPRDEGLEGRPFAFAQGDILHESQGDISPTASGHPSAEGRQPPLLGVILSAAKNLDCCAGLCNQALVNHRPSLTVNAACSFTLVGLRANPGFISLKRRAVRVRLHLPEQFNSSFKELICQFIQGVKLFL